MNPNLSIETSSTYMADQALLGAEVSAEETGVNAVAKGLGALILDASPKLASPAKIPVEVSATDEITSPATASKSYSADEIYRLLEIQHPVSADSSNMEFNSFMPSLALAAAQEGEDSRAAFLAGTLDLFGQTADSVRGQALKNAVYAFASKKPDGQSWSWMDFSDPMNDPLDDKNVYQY